MFNKFIIDNKTDIFQDLLGITEFEDITNGRKGAIIVDYKNDLIPIVRTTTIYNKPAQKFNIIHYDIIDKIKQVSGIKELQFNNALVEVYNSEYYKMGYHSDQFLDLANNSYICLYSCYENPDDTKCIRKLVVKDKKTNISSDIMLDNNSIILFSLETNSNYLHKIVLDNNKSDNRWLGITFRLSKTFVKFMENGYGEVVPMLLPANKVLELANEEQKKEFYKLKKLENLAIKYEYSDINYSISKSDLMQL
jgi:hypothetical protein